MATKPKKRFILNPLDIGCELGERVKKCVATDASLQDVALGRRRNPWLRRVIREACEKQEKNGKGGK